MSSIRKGLYIVSTPIGNLEDITLRAIHILNNSDIILCEDTRHSVKLLNHYKIKKKLISHHKFNEKKSIPKIIKYLNEGKILSIISDAGTPVLSDPGNYLVKECIKNDINIFPIPGPSAITSAAAVSGFDTKFLFYGFLPKKQNELEKVLKDLESFKFSIMFFVPSAKINFYLKNFEVYFKDRKIMIAKELTKIHEELIRGEINNLKFNEKNFKGELTVLISEKKNKKKILSQKELEKMIFSYLQKNSLKDTVKIISTKEKISKRRLYEKCLEIKNEKNL